MGSSDETISFRILSNRGGACGGGGRGAAANENAANRIPNRLIPFLLPRPALQHSGRVCSDLGYVEGKNIVIEWRFWEGKQDRQRASAAELVRLKVNVIVAVGTGDIRAAKEASATIPIVMISGGDAVGSGLVTSLARPGENVTGLATLRPELSGKRLELLKEIIPEALARGRLRTSTNPDHAQL